MDLQFEKGSTGESTRRTGKARRMRKVMTKKIDWPFPAREWRRYKVSEKETFGERCGGRSRGGQVADSSQR